MILLKRILGLLILMYSSTAFGQFSENGLMLNGTFLLNSELNPHSTTSGPTTPENSFAFKPSVGFFLSRNFEIGAQVGYSIINREEIYSTRHLYFRSTLFSAGIYGQRYFTLSKKIYFAISTSLTLGSGTDEYISGEGPLPANTTLDSPNIFQFSTSIRPTVIFFPLPKF